MRGGRNRTAVVHCPAAAAAAFAARHWPTPTSSPTSTPTSSAAPPLLKLPTRRFHVVASPSSRGLLMATPPPPPRTERKALRASEPPRGYHMCFRGRGARSLGKPRVKDWAQPRLCVLYFFSLTCDEMTGITLSTVQWFLLRRIPVGVRHHGHLVWWWGSSGSRGQFID